MSNTRRRSPVPNFHDIEMAALDHPHNTLSPPIHPAAISSGPPPIYHDTSARAPSTDSAATNPAPAMRTEVNHPVLEWCQHEMQKIPLGYQILSTILGIAFLGLLWIYFKELPRKTLESGTDWNSDKVAHARWVGIMTGLALVLVVGVFVICIYCAHEGARLGEEDVRRERLASRGRVRQPRPLTGAERRTMQRHQRHQREQEQVITNLTRAGII